MESLNLLKKNNNEIFFDTTLKLGIKKGIKLIFQR